MTRRRRLTALTALTCMALGAGLMPATSGATTSFGVNLSRPVDSSVGCAAHPLPGFGAIAGGSSCTWYTYGQTFTVTETTQVPRGNGTVTKVRVKEGANPGPMKITVLRQQGFATAGTNIACCVAVAESQVFTPTANAITEIATNLPVTNGTNPATGVPAVDYLAITVLNTSTSVPLSAVATDGSFLGVTFYPGVSKGQERFDGGITNYGYIALINADWEPGTSSTTTPTSPTVPGTPTIPTPTTPTTPATPTIPSGQFTVATPKLAKDWSMEINGAIPGPGIVEIDAPTAIPAKYTAGGRKPLKVDYGYETKYYKAGGPVKLKLKTYSLARTALKRGATLKVPVVVTYEPDDGPKTSKTFKLTVKGAKPKK